MVDILCMLCGMSSQPSAVGDAAKKGVMSAERMAVMAADHGEEAELQDSTVQEILTDRTRRGKKECASLVHRHSFTSPSPTAPSCD